MQKQIYMPRPRSWNASHPQVPKPKKNMNTMSPTHQSVNPHAKKSRNTGPITAMPMQKNKGPARRRSTMSNRGQGTHWMPGKLSIPRKTKSGHYPLLGETS
jgi:hypothetical protein